MRLSSKILAMLVVCFMILTTVGYFLGNAEGATLMQVVESAKQKYLLGEIFAAEDMYQIPVTEKHRLSRDGVIKSINNTFDGGGLHGMGDVLVDAVEYQKYEDDFGLDTLEWSMIIAAIIQLESRTIVNGRWVVATSWNTKNLNNICGMNRRTANSTIERYNLKWNGERVDYEHHGRYTKYPSVTESLRDMVYWLKVRYIMNSLDSIDKIHTTYAPLNDPEEGKNGMSNAKWGSNVTKFYNDILADAVKFSN